MKRAPWGAIPPAMGIVGEGGIMKFTLEIELGNEAMQTLADIEWSIQQVVGSLSSSDEPLHAGETGTTWDCDGNNVGKWEVTQ